MIVQVKKAELKQMLHGVSYPGEKDRVNQRNKNLIAAKPREHVDPSTRSKGVLGTCNR